MEFKLFKLYLSKLNLFLILKSYIKDYTWNSTQYYTWKFHNIRQEELECNIRTGTDSCVDHDKQFSIANVLYLRGNAMHIF